MKPSETILDKRPSTVNLPPSNPEPNCSVVLRVPKDPPEAFISAYGFASK